MGNLVSVIIPIYNKEIYLEKCLNSLKNQTYKNIEVLMIDDGSSDNSKDICNKYKEKDNRFNYFYQPNSGVSMARNLGLELSKGQWIMFVDPDDYVEDSLIETLFNEIDDVTDIVSCCCMANLDGNLILNEFFEADTIFFYNNKAHIVELIMQLMDEQYNAKSKRFTAIGVPWAKLYRKQMIIDNDLKFDKDLKRMQDNVFNMYAFDKARKFKYINQPLYIYSCDNILRINKKYDPDTLKYFNKIVQMRKEYLLKNDLMKNHEVKQAFCIEAYKLLTMMICKYFLHPMNKENFIQQFKSLKKYINQKGYKNMLESIDIKLMSDYKSAIKITLIKKFLFIYTILFHIKNKLS